MKKIFIYTTLLATIIACNKLDNEPLQKVDEPDSDVRMITETVTGGTESRTKVTIAEARTFSWTIGDNIAVHISNGEYVYTSDPEASGASTSAASASFTVVYPGGYSRDAFAIYPSTIVTRNATNYGQSGKSLDVTLPSSYTLAQVTGTTSPCPMIATNEPESGWTFSHLCSLLRLTVKSIPADATGLVIQFPGRKVNGSFSIASPVSAGTSTITTGTPEAGEDRITVTFDAAGTVTDKTLNIPLPTGTYEDISITPLGSSTKVASVRHIKDGSYTAERAHGRQLTASLVSFSVAADKKVIFSPGNLQATYDATLKTWDWHFAAHQYDRIGNGGGNLLITTSTKETKAPWAKLSADGTVDLFNRSTTRTYYGIAKTTTESYFNTSYSFVDWGTLDIDGRGENFWRTLTLGNSSSFEWTYLLTTRATGVTVNSTSDARYTLATINTDGTSVNGLILFPDNYAGGDPAGVTWGDINGYNKAHEPNAITKCTSSGWTSLESFGCVFLPVSGRRKNGSTVTVENEAQGCYMGYSTSDANKEVQIKVDAIPSTWNSSVSRGLAVRLVHDIE